MHHEAREFQTRIVPQVPRNCDQQQPLGRYRWDPALGAGILHSEERCLEPHGIVDGGSLEYGGEDASGGWKIHADGITCIQMHTKDVVALVNATVQAYERADLTAKAEDNGPCWLLRRRNQGQTVVAAAFFKTLKLLDELGDRSGGEEE